MSEPLVQFWPDVAVLRTLNKVAGWVRRTPAEWRASSPARLEQEMFADLESEAQRRQLVTAVRKE